MRKLLKVLVLTLAVNFLVVAGLCGWLVQSAGVDRKKIEAMKAVLFPAPATQPTTQPGGSGATARPLLELEELLAKYAGRPPAEQLQYIRRTFDAQMAQLDRSHRGLLDLQRQVGLAQEKLERDRLALEEQKKKQEAKEQESQKLATDKGFQDSLTLYESMPSKQAKAMFMALDDDTVVRYVQAMEGRTAAKITKEFKTPAELERLKRIMDKLRTASALPASLPSAAVSGKE